MQNPLIIRVPHADLNGGGADMRSRLMTWQWRDLPARHDGLVLDFSGNQFIEPWSLAQYTAYALRIRHEHGVQVELKTLPENPANLYVERMGLRHVLATGTSTPTWDDSHQNTGLHVIQNHADVTRFIHSAGALSEINAETMDALRYGMAELGRNAVQHAGSPIGAVAIAQYFPNRRAIQISVCDCGRGVFKAMQPSYPELRSDLEALKVAVLPHASGAFSDGPYASGENAGLGLFFAKEICWRAGGSFWLVSHDALLGVVESEAEGGARIYRRIEPWRGTSVTMDLPARGVDDFGSLLTLCNDLAAAARNASGPAGVDFLQELPDLPDGEIVVVPISPFVEDVEQAARIREQTILPGLQGAKMVVLDFTDVRFATQSFVHALLNVAFQQPGSLYRLAFLNCTGSTRQAIRAVAGYAASYRQITSRP